MPDLREWIDDILYGGQEVFHTEYKPSKLSKPDKNEEPEEPIVQENFLLQLQEEYEKKNAE